MAGTVILKIFRKMIQSSRYGTQVLHANPIRMSSTSLSQIRLELLMSFNGEQNHLIYQKDVQKAVFY